MKYTKDTILQFGKHKGERVADVIKTDANYIVWMSENISSAEFDEKFLEQVVALSDEQHTDWLRENFDEGDMEF